MSRTGYFTVFVVVVFALLFLAPGKGKRRGVSIVRATGWLALSFLLCLPIVFYLQRTIPALVSDPHIYTIEDYFQETTRGRELSSFQYARVGYFLEVFAIGIFNNTEVFRDFYGINQREEQLVVTADGTIMEKDEAIARGIENATTIKEKMETALAESDTEEAKRVQSSYDDYIGYSPQSPSEAARDYTSGRVDIFKQYMADFNMTGHDADGVVMPDGTSPYHAHNNYIQVAYDYGTFTGALFIIVGVIAFLQAIAYYRKRNRLNRCAAFPLLAIVAFAVMGITEVAFHFSNPAGFALLLSVTPLAYRS
jgi:hypothetical protein